MNFIFLGAPGSGKGTQAGVLAKEYGLNIISTGDILRAEVKNRSKMGRKIESFMSQGELVPDEVVIEVISDRLRGDIKGFILDGFPRNLAQAQALKVMLEDINKELDEVIYMKVGQEELIRRLSNRRTCSRCGAIYHLISKPPRNPGQCDVCGGQLHQRKDDKPSSVRRRFEVYTEETAPLISYYKEMSLLRTIEGDGSREHVKKRLLEIVSEGHKSAEEQISH